jgi:hypothetical protein
MVSAAGAKSKKNPGIFDQTKPLRSQRTWLFPSSAVPCHPHFLLRSLSSFAAK